MAVLILVMIMLPLLGCFFSLAAQNNKNNAFNVTMFTLVTNILVILRLFSQLDGNVDGLQFVLSYEWWKSANISLCLGVDAFSLLILLGIYISLIIGMVGLSAGAKKNKSLLILTLYFTCSITAFLTAGDMISFFAFFSAMLLPLFMLVGVDGNAKKSMTLYRFFIYNFIGILFLFGATLMVYKFYHGNVLLANIAFVDMPEKVGTLVWSAICLAFVSRIPVWPFHYWISSISAGIKNPLASIITNLLPLTGLYGFIRFWPLSVPDSIKIYLPYIEMFCVLTMIFIALIGLVHKEFLYKLFSYSTVYYLLFLLAVILPTDLLKMNIAYSLFIFLIVTSSLVILDLQLESECHEVNCGYRGILAYMPRFSITMSFFVLVAIGLPISSLFWNNFILVSAIMLENFFVGLWVMVAILLVALVLLQELYVMRDLQNHTENARSAEDISRAKMGFLMAIVVVLFLSFFNPLWFVF